MRTILTISFFCLLQNFCIGHGLTNWNRQIDSLATLLDNPIDTVKADAILELGGVYTTKGWYTSNGGQFASAYEAFTSGFDLLEDPKTVEFFSKKELEGKWEKAYWSSLANMYFNYGHLMGATENVLESKRYYEKTFALAKRHDDVLNMVYSKSAMVWIYLELNMPDSARASIAMALAYPPELYNYFNYSTILYIQGTVKYTEGEYQEARASFHKGMLTYYEYDADAKNFYTSINSLGLSKTYQALNMPDSSYYFGVQALRALKEVKEIKMLKIDLASGYENMYRHFSKFGDRDSAYKYLELASTERDYFSQKTIRNMALFQEALLKKQDEIKELEKETIQAQALTRTYYLASIIGIFLVLAISLYVGFRQKQKANTVLARQKDEVQAAMARLKSTQSQLIQAEKMASLGELTAGIAHEIQNPLNFVNNFSEVSSELIDEALEEVTAVKTRHALSQQEDKSQDEESLTEITDLLVDTKSNLEKITHHGKRADAIVKGMLAHSRAGKGEKEPTDLNALADEYLRLSYHGIRAKDNTFNADFKTELDPALPKVNVVPQDIGRVLLNLINNAFQASAGVERPLVIVSTKLLPKGIEISVQDNGPGIPDSIKDKIFQPFFTTKPTGQGTGLGLSLSYDIVKAHGGKLEVKTTAGEGLPVGQAGSIFLIEIPI